MDPAWFYMLHAELRSGKKLTALQITEVINLLLPRLLMYRFEHEL